jgi:aspartyl-tRNA(Asn)/glutamyl-tRNA(Gln) amidotransferase subunit A
MAIDPTTLTIKGAHDALRSKEYSAVALAEAVLAQVQKENPTINAYVEVFDDVMESAKHADVLLASGKGGELTGIPLGIKDNMLIAGKIVSSGSNILKNYRAVYDATVIAKLKESGAVLVGRTNMDEFAMGGSTETGIAGPAKNPVDPSRVPGGSSGGSAAAVAMGGALGALGSDTGGSIRQPASFCGIVGMKPTYGAVSRYGLMSMASSLDQIGTFAKTVADAELLYRVIAGHDPMDSTSVPENNSLRTPTVKKEKLTIGIPESFIALDGLDADVRENFYATIASLKDAGHTIKPVELPSLSYALSVYYVVMPAEVSANLARYDGIRYGLSVASDKLMQVYMESRGQGFGKEVRRRILMGTYVLSAGYYDAYYNKAIAVRRMIVREFTRTFAEVDVIATPTAPSPAWKIGAKISDPLAMYLEDIFTVPANIAGLPGISVPAGTVVRDGVILPTGIQFMAAPFHEDMLFAAGKSVETLQNGMS